MTSIFLCFRIFKVHLNNVLFYIEHDRFSYPLLTNGLRFLPPRCCHHRGQLFSSWHHLDSESCRPRKKIIAISRLQIFTIYHPHIFEKQRLPQNNNLTILVTHCLGYLQPRRFRRRIRRLKPSIQWTIGILFRWTRDFIVQGIRWRWDRGSFLVKVETEVLEFLVVFDQLLLADVQLDELVLVARDLLKKFG